MDFPYSPLRLLLPLFFLLLVPSTAGLHRARSLTTSEESADHLLSTAPTTETTPTTFFQVTRPIHPPKTKPCSTLVLQHDFGFTYARPPVTALYKPPSHCPHRSRNKPPSKIVLEWRAACKGRQFDRIFGIWLAGVELLRSCTAEPRATGIVWTVEKDITRYSSLLAKPQTLAVYLGNLIDQTYTGIYHVNITLHFYYDERNPNPSPSHRKLPPGFRTPADLILPISRNLPLNDGLWFLVQNSSDVQSKGLTIPRNSYRAVLEVYVSYHSSDEFWYTNPPNVYVSANNLSGLPGNGPFREVTVNLDGKVVGAVWPFTVIFTGGVNPLLWRPITGIGSFDLPSYDIEITPFLGMILDGEPHKFGFGVTNALDVWFVDANLHLWLDKNSPQTVGSLIKYEAPNFTDSLVSKFKGLDGNFRTSAARHISSTGWVKSSFGKITTHFSQGFDYKNFMQFAGNGTIQVINQTIESNYGVYAKHPATILYSEQVFRKFPLYLYTGTSDQTNETYSLISNISFGFNEKRYSGERFGFSISSLKNLQNAQGKMLVKGNLVQSGIGSTQQVYRYESMDGCYFRNVSSSNYTILYDESGEFCGKRSQLGSDFVFSSWLPYPSRRKSLSTDFRNLGNGD